MQTGPLSSLQSQFFFFFFHGEFTTGEGTDIFGIHFSTLVTKVLFLIGLVLVLLFGWTLFIVWGFAFLVGRD